MGQRSAITFASYFEPRRRAYRRMLEAFAKYIELGELNCERVEIPYQGTTLAGLYVAAPRSSASPAPCIAFFNGLDSTKEMIYGSRIGHELARRGISTLMVDQPGVGEALRLADLRAIVEAEQWAGACVDALEQRSDVDRRFLGICAWSLGGFFAPRAAAFEKRFRLCVAWGANFNWGYCKSGVLPAKAIARYLTTGNTCSGCGARSRLRSSWILRHASR